MAFRTTFSRLDNAPEAQAVSSLEMAVVINNNRVGRCQGLRFSYQGNPRPVQELGTDRVVEFLPGIKNFNGSLQSIAIKHGPLIRRMADMAGGVVDPDSLAATLSNFPEFNIEVYDRGNPNYSSPALYAPAGSSQNLAGAGKLVIVLLGCVIESGDYNLNANEAMIMESCSLRFVDIAVDSKEAVQKFGIDQPVTTL